MILLIGGTSETAPLATGLAGAGYAVLVSTATEAPLAIGEDSRISLRTGRLDENGLVMLGEEKGIQAVVDAAHPYAVEVHAAVQKAARRLGIPCLTFRRPEGLSESDRDPGMAQQDPALDSRFRGNDSISTDDCRRHKNIRGKAAEVTSDTPPNAGETAADGIRFAADHSEAARLAFADGRPVLLTTGSRNLAPYAAETLRTGIPLAVRVLDTGESLAACRAAGIDAERIIAGRGPFSVDENLAVIGRFGIGVLVTKESGAAGGLDAKLAAARRALCRVVVIRRPSLSGGIPSFDNPAPLIAALKDLVPPKSIASPAAKAGQTPF